MTFYKLSLTRVEPSTLRRVCRHLAHSANPNCLAFRALSLTISHFNAFSLTRNTYPPSWSRAAILCTVSVFCVFRTGSSCMKTAECRWRRCLRAFFFLISTGKGTAGGDVQYGRGSTQRWSCLSQAASWNCRELALIKLRLLLLLLLLQRDLQTQGNIISNARKLKYCACVSRKL